MASFPLQYLITPSVSRIRSVILVGCACLLATNVGAETNRFNLAEKPTSPRFTVTEKKWPANVGEADLCLWHEDKLSAISLGIDDNFAGEVEWWKEQTKLYDLKVTWWLITGRIKKEGRNSGGLWSQYQEMLDLGHGIGSHTVTHLHVEDPDWGGPDWSWDKAQAARKPALPSTVAKEEAAAAEAPAEAGAETPAAKPDPNAKQPELDPKMAAGVDWEYAQSIKDIEANMPRHKVGTLAYPGGKNSKYNRREIAAKYFRVARGTTGAPNMANQTDYMSTAALSGWNFESDRGGNPYNVLDNTRYRGRYYRGWVILFAHGVKGREDLMIKTFEFIKANREKLWLGLYEDVGKYGQQRDTATLKVESPGPEKFTFQLTDEMDDSYFNHPLTVKLRLPEGWAEVKAVQGDKPLTASVLVHEGAPYALVQAIPDAGLVTVTRK